jgi:hypothetical protein
MWRALCTWPSVLVPPPHIAKQRKEAAAAAAAEAADAAAAAATEMGAAAAAMAAELSRVEMMRKLKQRQGQVKRVQYFPRHQPQLRHWCFLLTAIL